MSFYHAYCQMDFISVVRADFKRIDPPFTKSDSWL